MFETAEKAVSGDASLLISQFALPGDVAKALYDGDPAYSTGVANLPAASLTRDMVFTDNTPEQIAAQTPELTGDAKAGFMASVVVRIAG